MKIEVLGPGCTNCTTIAAHVASAVEELGLTAEVVKTTDPAQIAAYGVMRTPGLVVDGEVLVSGRVPSADEVRELLASANRE